MFLRKGSSILIPEFDSCELDRVTIEMRHSNNFTHEPLWVVTHTAWVDKKRDVNCLLQKPFISEKN